MSNFNPWDSFNNNSSIKSGNKIFNFDNKFYYFNKLKQFNITIFLLFFIIVYLLSGFFIVKPDEESVITRFKKFVRIEKGGLHYKLPFPFEEKYTASVSIARTLTIGNDASEKVTKNLILTSDENIVDTTFEIQWQINDLKNYIFNIKNPELNLIQVSESVIRENIAQFNLSEILTNKRQEIELLNKENIQNILDAYKAGIKITSVQMLRADPPKQVIDAFRDVQTARVDRESEINNAMIYYNTKIPEARGMAKEIKTKAEAEAYQKINVAKGDVALYNAIHDQYKAYPNIVKAKIYIEYMEEFFKKSNTTIVDSELKNIFLDAKNNLREIDKKTNNINQNIEVAKNTNENND